jgi:probable phosphomutase (TIGR03848 family)
VPTVLLVRHGLTAATGTVLSGRTPGLHLSEAGQGQATALAERLAQVPLAAIVSSPLERCQETATALAAGRPLELRTDDRFVEVSYGEWTGRPLKDLARDPMWKTVQTQPSAARFPGGESLTEVSARAVAAVRDWNARVDDEFGEDAVWIACSHGDVIKAVLADALGLHLDQFQRIVVDPCSVSVVRYTATRPYVLRSNDVGSDLSPFVPPKRRRRRKAGDDATVGGGAGSGTV